ncbi:hypothetical protein PMAYCL1PPCAC_04005, partial [Pristionchus mayeri]
RLTCSVVRSNCLNVIIRFHHFHRLIADDDVFRRLFVRLISLIHPFSSVAIIRRRSLFAEHRSTLSL